MVSIAAFQAVDPGSIPGRRNFFQAGSVVKVFKKDGKSGTQPTGSTNWTSFMLPSLMLTKVSSDEVAEWLRRWTANPMGSARVGSNPILVGTFYNASLTLAFINN